MQTILRWLLTWLEKSLEPDLKIRLKALNDKIAAMEQRERDADAAQKLSDAIYVQAASRRATLLVELTESRKLEAVDEQSLIDSKERRGRIADELAKTKADIDALDPSSKVRVGL